MVKRAKITIKGIVQGVGFRPFVYNLADSLNLKGYVTNNSDGVSIEAEGANLPDFIERLSSEAPPLSKIFELSVSFLPAHGYTDFRIIESIDEGRFTLISHDVSICDECLRELFSPSNRRYLYPFINCTNCGPRFTITKSIPYDRPNTTMSVFEMCGECYREYNDPKDRRFHAQPNACPECGPQVSLVIDQGLPANTHNPIERAIELLKDGRIIAIKGLGGFHLACDATNEGTVKRLRERKRRSNKPFALMAPDVKMLSRFCEVSEGERMLLLSNRRPILLLRKKDATYLPEVVAPNNKYLGFMLPYTPLHYLLFYYPIQGLPSPNFNALVMTSGNMSEEPIVKDNDEAVKRLSTIADAFLIHNRDIFMRVDDSVVAYHPLLSFIRRSRGYVPEPIKLKDDGPEVIGCGADLKNTFTVTKGRFAILSQHIGDMENYETLRFFEESLENIKGIYRVRPVALAYDLHPNYLSSRWAKQQQGLLHFPIQHHYAHIGSVMAEHGLKGSVIGVAFDGTGYGTDENLWGGEFLVADLNGFKRVAHLKYIALPGGETAVRQPWRTAISYILHAKGDRAMDFLRMIGFVKMYGQDIIEKVFKVINVREFSPLSSGAGRLFDAVSAILGICHRNTFEAEAAIALESFTINGIDESYLFDIHDDGGCMVIDLSCCITGIIDDLIHGLSREVISTKFHNTVSDIIIQVVKKVSERYNLNDVVLSGGTFQNQYLLERAVKALTCNGMNVFINQSVPCNDGGISLGQAFICRERLKEISDE